MVTTQDKAIFKKNSRHFENPRWRHRGLEKTANIGFQIHKTKLSKMYGFIFSKKFQRRKQGTGLIVTTHCCMTIDIQKKKTDSIV